ncbi:MAG: hypothetical protein WBO43_00970 [Gemmatimonadota bacterium]
MKTRNEGRNRYWTPVLLLALLVCVGCGDDDSGPDDEQTGTVLQGTVIEFQAQVVPGGFALAATEGVNVSIGSKSTQTDANGNFTLRDFQVGNQNVDFSLDQDDARLVLTDVEPGDEYDFLFSINGGQVSTQHTGTWVGQGGSSDPGSQGPVTITMIIAQNGNALSGTASIPPPDNTSWNISGTETGFSVDNGTFTVTTTNSFCASDGEFEGTFTADTLVATFDEVRGPDWTAEQEEECGPVESGGFTLIKQ